MLTEDDMALWWRLSPTWFQKGRQRGYGPPFIEVAPNVIRYLRGGARGYLRERTVDIKERRAAVIAAAARAKAEDVS
jgi:hypothetical protein